MQLLLRSLSKELEYKGDEDDDDVSESDEFKCMFLLHRVLVLLYSCSQSHEMSLWLLSVLQEQVSEKITEPSLDEDDSSSSVR